MKQQYGSFIGYTNTIEPIATLDEIRRTAVLISVDYSQRRLAGKKWEAISKGIVELIEQMRLQDFFAINMNGSIITGTPDLTTNQILIQFESHLNSIYTR